MTDGRRESRNSDEWLVAPQIKEPWQLYCAAHRDLFPGHRVELSPTVIAEFADRLRKETPVSEKPAPVRVTAALQKVRVKATEAIKTNSRDRADWLDDMIVIEVAAREALEAME